MNKYKIINVFIILIIIVIPVLLMYYEDNPYWLYLWGFLIMEGVYNAINEDN